MKTLMVVVLSVSSLLAQIKTTPAARAMAACGPDHVKFDVSQSDDSQRPDEPEAGKALVYVIEQESLVCLDSCHTTTKVGLDGSWVGANRGNSYFLFAVAPGEHHLCVEVQSRPSDTSRTPALVGFNAEAGRTYYFRARYISERFQSFLDLDPINYDQANFLVVSYQESIARAKN